MLGNNSSKFPQTFLKRKEKVISSIFFSDNDIAKAHGPDMVSVLMPKICRESISKLDLIIKSFIENVQHPDEWEKKEKIRKSQKTRDMFHYF